MSAQHTPGPWKVFSVFADAEVRTEDGTLIAVVPARRGARNARLIATAPDLIVAAQRLERRGFFAPSTCADDETAADMALMGAAIAKATGSAS